MKLLYVDETDRQANAQKRLFFCICGLIVDDSVVLPLSNELEAIKVSYGLSNLKESRNSGLDKASKIKLTEEIARTLIKFDAKVVGIVLGDFSMSFNLPLCDMYMGAMSFMAERFALTVHKAGVTGIAIFDCLEPTLEKCFQEKFYTYVMETPLQMHWQDKPLGQMNDFLLPTLHFVDDQQTILVQAIDLIATSLNSAIVNTTKNGFDVKVSDLPSGNDFLKIYWPLFVTSPTGKISGWGIKVWH